MCGFCAGRARLPAHMAGSVRACLDKRRGRAHVLDLIDRIGLAVVPLNGKRPYATVLVHARRDADVPLDPSRDAFDHDARLPEEPYGVDGIVTLDVEAGHDLVGKFGRPLHAGVAETLPQRVDGEVQPLKALRLLGVPEELALHGHVHGNEIGHAHVHRRSGVSAPGVRRRGGIGGRRHTAHPARGRRGPCSA